jgi:hypothetical protein
MNPFISIVRRGSGSPATNAQRAASNPAQMLQQAMQSAAVQREVEAQVKRYVQERLGEALRRGGSGVVKVNL